VPDLWQQPIRAILAMASFFVPVLFALKGMGTRRIWIIGGVLGLGMLYVLTILSSVSRYASPQAGASPVTWDVNPNPTIFLLGGGMLFCIAAALGFIVAGIFYRPRKERSTGLLTDQEGGNHDARRANGKDQGD
jgi:uncharacterized SAM-binding protein YcdF (DUF218 family)